MGHFFKKFFTTVIVVIIGMTIATAQSNTVKHIVDKGETLSSIATRYGTTTEKIIALNPDAAQFVYVGMELLIPITKVADDNSSKTTLSSTPSSKNAENHIVEYNPNHKNEVIPKDEDAAGLGFAIEINAGFPKAEGAHPIALDFLAEAPYWFQQKEKGIFASIGLGYSSYSVSASESINHTYYSAQASYSLINIPVKAGFAICGDNKKIALTPYVGLNLGITVKGTTEVSYGSRKEKLKLKSGKFAPDFRLGAFLRLWVLDIGGYFAIPMTDDAKAVYGSDGYFGASLAFGF